MQWALPPQFSKVITMNSLPSGACYQHDSFILSWVTVSGTTWTTVECLSELRVFKLLFKNIRSLFRTSMLLELILNMVILCVCAWVDHGSRHPYLILYFKLMGLILLEMTENLVKVEKGWGGGGTNLHTWWLQEWFYRQWPEPQNLWYWIFHHRIDAS